MATPRGFLVSTAILRRDWPDDVVASIIRLMGYMQEYGTPTTCTVHSYALMQIAGKRRIDAALRVAGKWQQAAGVEVERINSAGSVSVRWPNSAEFWLPDDVYIASLRAEISRQRHAIVTILAARDGHGCQLCAAPPPYHIDHKLPLSRGGTNATENLQLLCPPCNLSKGAKVLQ